MCSVRAGLRGSASKNVPVCGQGNKEGKSMLVCGQGSTKNQREGGGETEAEMAEKAETQSKAGRLRGG